MAALKNRINEEVKNAMRARDKTRLGTLRLISAAIKQREVDERIELNDDQVIEILTKMIKQRNDSISQYGAAGRDDLRAVEEAELAIINEFMPEQLSDEQIDALIDEAIAATAASSMKDMGKAMGSLKPKLAGRADMGAVSAKIKARLAG